VRSLWCEAQAGWRPESVNGASAMHGRVPLPVQPEDLRRQYPEDGDIDLRRIVDFLWRRWKMIAATALGTILLAILLLITVTPRYTATALVLLEPRKDNIFGSDSILPELNLDAGSVDSQISVVQSVNLLRRVVEKQKLADDPDFGKAEKPGLGGLIKKLFIRAGEAGGSSTSDWLPGPARRAIEALSASLDVKRVARTYVISISVTLKDPQKAVRLANAVADAYVVDRLDARYEAAKRAATWLTERIEGLRAQLQKSEKAVADFRLENNLTTTTSEGKVTVNEQQLAELNAKLVAARADTAEKRAKYQQAQDVKDRGGNLEAIPDVVRSEVITNLRKLEADVTRKEADLMARYSRSHPAVVNSRAERRDIERNIAAEVARIIANMKNDYDVAKAREDSLQLSLDRMTGQDGGDSDIGVKLRELERVNAANKTLFENFLSRAKITQEQTAFEEREARIISPAVLPGSPTFPNKALVLSLALVLGIGFGVAGGSALDMLNSGFATPREIELALGRPVLAVVPLLADGERRIERKVVDPVNYLLQKPLSRFCESIRATRVGVQMADVDDPPKVVLVTSSVPKEGKSTLSTCLAFSAAKAGQRVLLIDGDLRHPSLSEYFGLKGRAGLVDVLTGGASLESATVVAGPIVILPAGSQSQNPADLLGSARMKQVLTQLRDAYDYVLIDSPPVAPIVDARVMSNLVDKIVYVVRWQSTAREIVVRCLEQLSPDRKLAGVVFSLVNESKASRYGAYAYYSNKSYRGYYES
jgi:succinoglycan biosynthesis transport protein ExoP